jgi:hypothetical protein
VRENEKGLNVNEKAYPTTIIRRRSRGANLALLVAVGVMILGFIGVSIYTSFQSYMLGELQKAASNAAQVGASAYYSSSGPGGKPAANGANAISVATNAFNTAVASSSSAMSTYGFTATSVTNNDTNDSVTVVAQGTIPTAFLRPLGVNDIELNATATARALRYEPTRFTGPIKIMPIGTDIASYSRVLSLRFPMVDIPGNDLYVEQVETNQQGVIVEACNDTECYDLTPGATPVGTSQIMTQSGRNVLVGTAMFDLARAGVRKANKIRITHSNQFEFYDHGVLVGVPTAPTPLVINRIMMFGYAGNCVNANLCPVPAGFAPVE